MWAAIYTFAMAKAKKIEAPATPKEPEQPVKTAPHKGWSKRFLATCGAWKEEIELPEQSLLSDQRNPFE